MTLKKFSTSFLTVAGFLAITAVVFLSGNLGGVKVAEAAKVSVTGYAWSDNIGWIDFSPAYYEEKGTVNSNCTALDCGVFYDKDNGQFSGYAWSDNIGWVSFNGLSTNGGVGGTAAKADSPLNITNSTISGWARACAGTTSVLDTCSTMTSRTDGWDGWMRFDKDLITNFPTLNPAKIDLSSGTTRGDLNGYVWGGDVVGWVSLNCKEGGAVANNICKTGGSGASDYKVHANLDGIALSATCSVTNNAGVIITEAKVNENVTVTANPSGGKLPYTYSWTGDWSGTSKTLTKSFTVPGPKTTTVIVTDNAGSTATVTCGVQVNNSGGPYELKVEGSGGGAGNVSGGGINCDINNGVGMGTCQKNYTSGSNVTLSQSASAGSVFGGWTVEGGGSCSGTGDCELNNITSDKKVTATFNCAGICGTGKNLIVTIVGKGTVSGPDNNSCSNSSEGTKTCPTYKDLTGTKTLTAKASFGWAFTGWTQNCSTYGIAKKCDITMNDNKDVTATFNKVKIIEI